MQYLPRVQFLGHSLAFWDVQTDRLRQIELFSFQLKLGYGICPKVVCTNVFSTKMWPVWQVSSVEGFPLYHCQLVATNTSVQWNVTGSLAVTLSNLLSHPWIITTHFTVCHSSLKNWLLSNIQHNSRTVSDSIQKAILINLGPVY